MSQEMLVFLAEVHEHQQPVSVENGPAWRVLVVDDEPDIHSMTRLVLKGFRFRGRPLVLYEAHSAREAREVLNTHGEMAVILLDVVMESEHAGLELIPYIRDTMGHIDTRIILRTGQAGAAPERHVILNFDINDYKSKTELSADKMFTSMVAALRAFDNLKSLDNARCAERQARLETEQAQDDHLRLERRKSDERKVELLAISQMLSGEFSPRLFTISEMAGLINSTIADHALACGSQDNLSASCDAAANLHSEVQRMSEIVEELVHTLANVS
jgi:CheY-like chemotaxis protein